VLRERVLLGHPLIARSIIAAARAGVRDFLIVCDEGANRLAELLAGNRVLAALARQGCTFTCRSLNELSYAEMEAAADLAVAKYTTAFSSEADAVRALARNAEGLDSEGPDFAEFVYDEYSAAKSKAAAELDAGCANGEPIAEPFLLLSDTAVFHENAIAPFLQTELAPEKNLLLVNSGARALQEAEQSCEGVLRVRLAADPGHDPGHIEEIGSAIHPGEAAWTGIALCQAPLYKKLLTEFKRSPREGIQSAFTAIFPPDTTATAFLSGGYAIDVRSKALYTSARRTLLASVRKASDGFVSRHFNRYVSLFLSRIFIALGASPNLISGANLLLALLSAVFLAWGGYPQTLAAALLFQLTSIIDGSDGEVAKLTWKMSPRGAWIDTVCDQLSYVMFFVALPLGLYNSPVEETRVFMITALGRETFLALGGAVLLAFPLMFALMARYVRRAGGEGSMLQIIKDIEASARGEGVSAFLDRMVSKLAFLFRRDFFAFAAMIILILQLAGALMWIVAVACWVQLLYLVYYSARRFHSS